MNTQYMMTTELKTLAGYLGAAAVIAFDFETAPTKAWREEKKAALNPHKAEIVGISLSVGAGTGVYLPLRHRNGNNANGPEIMMFLKDRVFENPGVLKIAHNLGFEALFLLGAGINLMPPVYDTMAGAQMILKDEDHFRGLADAGLKQLARSWVGIELPSYEATVGTGNFAELDQADPQTIDYACADSDLALRLYHLEIDWFAKNLPAHGKLVQELESPVALFTARMVYRGLRVNQEAMAQAETQLHSRLDKLRKQLQSGGTRGVRIGENAATNDFKNYLFEDCGLPVFKTTETGRPSVDGEALEMAIAYCEQYHPQALAYLREVIAYRQMAKLAKTYVIGLREKINPVTAAIHTQFYPLGTETGRFASRNPNCQNLPGGATHGVKIRDFFIPRAGYTLVALDYSQIELRIGAWFTGDEQMLAVYRDGGDIHGVTTAAVYGISLEEALDKNHPEYKERRTVAKNINFGIFYGLNPKGLQRLLKLKAGQNKTLGECEAMIRSIHQAYPGLAPWQRQVKEAARYRRNVATALGRRRCLPGIADADLKIRSHYERAAMNHPIQGTAADILKLAMVRLLTELAKRPTIHPVLTVHDEIVFEVENNSLDEAIKWLKTTMEAQPFPGFNVPLTAEAATGPSYGAMKPWLGK